ncbi:MAG: hypothetical protein AB7I33_01440 [Gemmatimonadales bacterium]
MILTLAFRHLLVRPARSLVLLLGYSLDVAVMIVLLSVGTAMLNQSRDVALVGGGEVTALPEGIDVEALRTGGLTGMFFGIDRARYVSRQVLGGPRHRDMVAGVNPLIEGKLVYLRAGDRTVAVRAGGEIPSRARLAGAGLDVRQGRWDDTAADTAWIAPTGGRLYDEIDRFHLPEVDDSTWAEWHYFNVVTGPEEWWYITFLVGGRIRTGRWGGQILVTHRRPDGTYGRFSEAIPSSRIELDTARADLRLGGGSVLQDSGVYRVNLRTGPDAGSLEVDLRLLPEPHQYFPPLLLREGEAISGYVVPALSARASGRLCAAGRCRSLGDAPAYHDHNWDVWRGVRWDWGTARGARLSLLYGQVQGGENTYTTDPVFVALVDSLGVSQVLRARGLEYEGSRPAAGPGGVTAPERFAMLASRGADSIRVRVTVLDALATQVGDGAAAGRYFLQMRGGFRLEGRIRGRVVSDSGRGFFETWREHN